jgi:hypothetical protein
MVQRGFVREERYSLIESGPLASLRESHPAGRHHQNTSRTTRETLLHFGKRRCLIFTEMRGKLSVQHHDAAPVSTEKL